MTEPFEDRRGAALERVDLTGARLRQVRLSGARFWAVDLSGSVMRAVDVSNTTIDCEDIDGLLINGVDVAPLVRAELVRREPARAVLPDDAPAGPDEFRAAWASLESSWTSTYARVAALPAETVDVSVEGEWSFAQTLRHLVFATDGWLGAIIGDGRAFHPWGVPFTELPKFYDHPDELGIDHGARPGYAEVLEVRLDRVTQVRDYLAGVTDDDLEMMCTAPVWDAGASISARECLKVIIDEESEHRRFAERDLDLIERGATAG